MRPIDYGKWTKYYTSFADNLTIYNAKVNWAQGHVICPTKYEFYQHGKPWPPTPEPAGLPEVIFHPSGYPKLKNMNPYDFGKWTLSHPIAFLLYIGTPKRHKGHIDLPNINYMWVENKKVIKEKLNGVEKWIDVEYQKQYEKSNRGVL